MIAACVILLIRSVLPVSGLVHCWSCCATPPRTTVIVGSTMPALGVYTRIMSQPSVGTEVELGRSGSTLDCKAVGLLLPQ